jgi:hypothetical protein
MRIPVFANGQVIELADEQRARQLAKGQNARWVKARKSGRKIGIHLDNYGASFTVPAKNGNPRRYSHDNQTDDNPAGVWTLKHLPASTAHLFRLSVTENLAYRPPAWWRKAA